MSVRGLPKSGPGAVVAYAETVHSMCALSARVASLKVQDG